MSFINLIEKIQNKPRHIRIQVLWLSVFICMLIVVSLWVFSLKYSLLNVANTNEETDTIKEFSKSVKEVKKEIPSLKESLKASISSLFERSKDVDNEALPEELERNNQLEREQNKIKPVELPLSQ